MAKREKSIAANRKGEALESFIREFSLEPMETLDHEKSGYTLTEYRTPRGTPFKQVIVLKRKDGKGWDIFIPADESNSISTTLAKVEAYLKS